MPYVGDGEAIRARADESRARPSRLKIVLGVAGVLLWIALMVTLRLVAGLLRIPGAKRLPMFFHRGVCRLFRLSVRVEGSVHSTIPTLYVCNHVSYLDVFVLGSHLPGSFIAKSEVAGWPVFGKLARLQNTLFFERNSRRAADQIRVMQDELGRGNLIFFPEGTSTPGTHVEPFRSSLFAAAEPDIAIQPVSIAYTRYDGQPMTQAERDYYAWYLPMTFLPHFLNALGLRRTEVVLTCHEPVTVRDTGSRKAVAKACEEMIRESLARQLGA